MDQCKHSMLTAWVVAFFLVFMSAVADARLIRVENNLASIDISAGSELVDIRGYDIDGPGDDEDVTTFSTDLFGNTYSQLYVNNNGSVSFGSAFNGTDPFDPSAPPIFAGFFNSVYGTLPGIRAELTSSADSSICSELCMFIDFFFDDDPVDTFFDNDPDLDGPITGPISQIAIFSNGEGDNGFKVEFNFNEFFHPTVGTFGIFDGAGGGIVFNAADLDQEFTNYDRSFADTVPEPDSLALLLLGLMTIMAVRQFPRLQPVRAVERQG